MEIKGIDVSRWNGKIDWETVSSYGMGFAILRITEKGNIVDNTFESNYKGCIQNNIPVGVYKYSYATSINQIKEEANIVIRTLNKRKLDYPVFLDLEDKCQENISQSVMMQMIDAFRDIILKSGYKFGIYCGNYWYKTKLPEGAKKYDCWLAAYPINDNGTLQERLRPENGIGWQYSSKAVIPGITTKVDRNVFYKNYCNDTNKPLGGGNSTMTKDQMIEKIREDAVDFAVRMANDNKHGYSQRIRSLYNITNPTSFDCSSLTCTAYYYAFLRNGLKEQAEYLKAHCSYTGNMLNMLNCGFEVVARNQTAHSQMIKGDLELNTTHHVAMAVNRDVIVHARSSEGTGDTKDNSGNEIRTQSWYLYSHGWTHRLRFTGKGVDFSDFGNSTDTPITPSKGYLEIGDSGTDVKALQQKLNKLGIKDDAGRKLEEDGEFGSATQQAVMRFQKKYGLEVDGKAGKNTINKLDALIASQDASKPSGFKSFVGACTTDNTGVYAAKTGNDKLGTYPKLNRGNLVDVINQSGNRYQIRIANKYTGWIDKSRIVTPNKLNSTPAASKYPFVGECTGNDVNVRKNAGTNYAPIAEWPQLDKTNRVDVLGSKKGTDGKVWYKVRIQGKYIGYVRSDYIKKVS